MGRNREDELYLADIGEETDAATHETSIAHAKLPSDAPLKLNIREEIRAGNFEYNV